MDLIEIGKMLRETREQKGLTIAAVEGHIKIGQSVIVALEEGNKDRFPHPVYARGFLRSYALLLDLDAVELCNHFSREYPVPLDCDPPETRSLGMSVRSREATQGVLVVWFLALLGALAVGIAGWYIYGLYQDGWGKKTVSTSVSKAENELAGSLDVAVRAESPVSLIQDEPSEFVEAQNVNASSDIAFESDHADADIVAEKEQDQGAAEAVAPQSDITDNTIQVEVETQAEAEHKEDAEQVAAVTGEHRLVIKAHAASWLQARPDDSVTDYFLRKGESATIRFSSTLTVKFGNAGGVTLELDGEPYPFEAQSGEVRTLIVK